METIATKVSRTSFPNHPNSPLFPFYPSGEQPNGAVICEDPDEPFQEPETEEEKFKLPFPKRAATDDFLKKNEEEFIVPFPHPQKRQREN